MSDSGLAFRNECNPPQAIAFQICGPVLLDRPALPSWLDQAKLAQA
jgi:hypothetical protein